MRKRPDSARQELRRQPAQVRRGAPGKRFIGGTAAQSAKARRAEIRKVERMAKANAAEARRETELRQAEAARRETELRQADAARLEAELRQAEAARFEAEAMRPPEPVPVPAAREAAPAQREAESVMGILLHVAGDALRLARSLALAPFQITRAFLRLAEA